LTWQGDSRGAFSEGGMNLITTDINQLINTMGVKSLAGKKREEKSGRRKVKAES